MLHEVLAGAEAKRALAERDIATVYRLLKEAGVSQRRIADLTGQSQSPVHDIVHGRAVKQYDVLARIAEGLGIDRAAMGLAYGSDTYADSGHARRAATEEVTDDMRRRAFLAAAAAAVCGSPVLGDALELPGLPGPDDTRVTLPTRLGMGDVRAVRDLTERLRVVARTYGGQADTLGALAARSTRLMYVAGADTVRRALGSALAELQTTAGWACYDVGADDAARTHFTTALELATTVDDPHAAASSLRHAGIMTTQRGAPNDGLKLYQLAQLRLMDTPSGDDKVIELRAWLKAHCASALVDLGRVDDGVTQLVAARDGWQPPDPYEQADMDWLTAQLHMRLGRLDLAEPFASSSVHAWGNTGRREGTMAETTLATLHVQAGEPRGPELAQRAIGGVAELRSNRARDRLLPLAEALEVRRYRDLAQRAREVATSRA